MDTPYDRAGQTMTSEKQSPAKGQERNGTNDELQTEGGLSRRVFLGAAAALSALSSGSSTAAADDETEEEDVSSEDSGTVFGRDKVVETPGSMELHVGVKGNKKTKLIVSSSPEGIGLKLSNEIGTMHTLLLPEDIEPLCEELLEAREKTRPGDVEHTRDWITEEFRDGDTDE